MPAATTSGVAMRRKVETTFGTAPSGNWQDMRFTGESLTPNVEYANSAVIRSDGQVPNVVQVDAEGGGTINGELAYGEWDDWFQSVIMSEAADSAPTTSGSVTIVAATGTVPAQIQKTGAFTTAGGWGKGKWVYLTGSATSADNRFPLKVIERADNVLHVQGKTLTAEGPSSITVKQFAEWVNGVTLQTWALEIEDTVNTDEFRLYLGLGINGMTVEMPEQGIVTCSFDVIGKVPSTQATTSGGTAVAALTSEPFSTVDTITFYEGDPDLSDVSTNALLWDESPYYLTGFSLNVTPNLRTRKAAGTLGPALVHGRGTIAVTGSLSLYYHGDPDGNDRDDKALFDKVLNGTTSGIAIVFRNSAEETIIFDMSQVKFTSGSRTSNAADQDVIMELEFTAFRNNAENNYNADVTGSTIRISTGDMS